MEPEQVLLLLRNGNESPFRTAPVRINDPVLGIFGQVLQRDIFVRPFTRLLIQHTGDHIGAVACIFSSPDISLTGISRVIKRCNLNMAFRHLRYIHVVAGLAVLEQLTTVVLLHKPLVRAVFLHISVF
ncbi:hypothetical protein D3C73_1290440 [compost metagenome]